MIVIIMGGFCLSMLLSIASITPFFLLVLLVLAFFFARIQFYFSASFVALQVCACDFLPMEM
jgi:hypothetical protein